VYPYCAFIDRISASANFKQPKFNFRLRKLTCAKVNEKKTKLHNLEHINTQTCSTYYKMHVNFEILYVCHSPSGLVVGIVSF